MKKKFKLPKNVKAKWVKALRSGKYEQTQGRLKRDCPDAVYPAGFCCLGVAVECNLTEKARTTQTVLETFLPSEIQANLANFNDNENKSFKWIAYYIERYL
jgi:hypothetical protein